MLFQSAKKLVVFVIGSTVLLAGVIMIVTPGPAVIVIPAGLAILGTEFLWARLLLRRIKRKANQVIQMATGKSDPGDAAPKQ